MFRWQLLLVDKLAVEFGWIVRVSLQLLGIIMQLDGWLAGWLDQSTSTERFWAALSVELFGGTSRMSRDPTEGSKQWWYCINWLLGWIVIVIHYPYIVKRLRACFRWSVERIRIRGGSYTYSDGTLHSLILILILLLVWVLRASFQHSGRPLRTVVRNHPTSICKRADIRQPNWSGWGNLSIDWRANLQQ